MIRRVTMMCWVLCLVLLMAACGTTDEGSAVAADTRATEDTTQVDDVEVSAEADGDEQPAEETGTSEMGTQTDDDLGEEGSTQSEDDDTQADPGSDDTDVDEDVSVEDVDSDTGTDEGAATQDLNGKWEGSYTCSQGFTRLTLQVVHDLDTGTLDAVFAFFADNSNPDVPTGRYTMSGSYSSADRSVDLDEGEWIEQPGGYVMVSLDGVVNTEGTQITGTVVDFGCTEFSVNRGN